MRATRLLAPLATLALLLGSAPEARADDELKIDYAGQIQTDLRLRLQTKSVGDYYGRVSAISGVERNQNRLGIKVNASYGQFGGAVDIDLVVLGYSGELQSIQDLSAVEKVQPYRFDINSLYLEAKNLFTKGLDVRIGQQLVLWGVGDQFNPTNNLNPDDLRDPLLFGKQAGNFMVKADYWLNDDWSFSGVLVPIFKPALLPFTAPLAVGAVDRLPFIDPEVRRRIESEFAFAGSSLVNYPVVVSKVTPTLPEPSFENMQFAFRIAGTLADQDVALSYYNGRTDFPHPFANHTTQVTSPQPICDTMSPRCALGRLQTETKLHYPKMHVYGLNAAGEIPLSWARPDLGGIGYRLEAALVVPQEARITLTNEDLDLGGLPQPAGEYDYDADGTPGGGRRPLVVENTPFLKWTVGLDYAFGDHVYTNVQWVHGLMDEYGAGDFIREGYVVRKSGVTTSPANTLNQCVFPARSGEKCARELLRPRLGDYLVLGVDLKFLSDKALLRLFGILDLTPIVEEKWDDEQQKRVQTVHAPFSKEAASAVFYPDFNYNFGNGLELGAGALLQMGKTHTKFGDPAGGGSLVFTRGRYSF